MHWFSSIALCLTIQVHDYMGYLCWLHLLKRACFLFGLHTHRLLSHNFLLFPDRFIGRYATLHHPRFESYRMISEKSVSFRSNLNSHVMDLMQDIDWHCTRTSRLIAGIVSRLAAYTEEGVAMAPAVFICNSISELLQRAGMGEYVLLSAELSLDDSVAGAVLKATAPLCRDNWRIYVERLNDGSACRFGVFCGRTDPTSMTIDEVVLSAFETGFPIVRISQNATNKVEVRTNAGTTIEFRFNDDVDVNELSGQNEITSLAKMVCRDINTHLDVFPGFVERILSSAINNSHGTLIAVVPDNSAGLPSIFQDVVALETPIDLLARFNAHVDEGKTAASVSRLQASAELLSGFISSDGITIFNSNGKIMGYRAFIVSAENGIPPIGGARSRAFSAMRKSIGTELSAAFFRSQDGRTEFYQELMG
jgi:hypothetical protein